VKIRRPILFLAVICTVMLLFSGCASMKANLKDNELNNTTVIPEYYGAKKRIAVMGFEDKVPKTPERLSLLQILFGQQGAQSDNLGTGMSDMLTTSLVESNRFIVVERQNLEDVMKEQSLGASGMVNEQTAPKIGEILGTQVFIRGAVTEFQERTGGNAGGFGFGKFGIGVSTSQAHVAIDIKIYDASTGVILFAKSIDKNIQESGLFMATTIKGITFGGGGFSKTPIGRAVRECINEAVNAVIAKMEKIPWRGSIVKMVQGKIYVNAGQDANLKAGDLLTVYRKGEEFLDPETGLSLGSEETKVGVIKIDRVEPKFSVAFPVEGSDFKRKDVLKFQ